MSKTIEQQRIEEALRESEEKLSKAFQAVPALLSISRLADGTYIEVNETLEKTLGYGREEIIGRAAPELGIWENPAERGQLVRLLREGIKVRDLEVRLRSKTGDLIIGSLSAEIIDVQGEECLLALTRDVTGIKQAEEKLRRSEQQLAEAQRLAHLGNWEWNIGADTLTASAELYRIFGVTPEELDATYAGILSMVHPDDRGKYEHDIRAALETRKSYENYHRIILPDGKVRTLHSQGTVTVDEKGEPTTIFGTCQDVTERMRAEEALRESEKLFRATFNQAAVGIAHTGLDGRWLRVNQKFCEILGYTEEELMAQDIRSITHPDDLEISARYFQLLLDKKLRNYTLEKRYLRKDGSPVWVNITVSMIEDADGRDLFNVGVVEDISARKKIEEELRASEERYRSLVELAPDAIIIHQEGRFVYANAAALQLYGAETFGELQEKNVLELIHPEERDVVRARMALIREGTKVPSREFRMLRLDGSEVHVEAAGRAIEFQGTPAIQAIIRDNSVRKRAEQEREQLLMQLDAVLSSIHEGVVIADLEGNVVTMNPAALAMHEYESAEQARRQLLELQDTFELSDLAGKPLTFEQWPMARVLCAESFVDYEVRARRKDTGTSWIGSYSGTPVLNKEGEVILAVITLRDVTSRKRAEDELRQSEERYRRLYTETPVMLHSIDRDRRLVNVSDYWLNTLGYERGEVLGRRTTEFLTEASRSYADEVVLPEFFQTGSCKDVPYQFVKKNGEVLDTLLSAIAERDDNGEVVRSLAVMIDVTERKRAEEEVEKLNTDLMARANELEAANRELEAFSYTVSHDLRKPLTVINGYSQIIMEICGSALSRECTGFLGEIGDATIRMSRLIDILLEFSRLTRCELRRENVDLCGMARSVVAELSLAEPERGVTFNTSDRMTVNADAGLMRVVLANLLGNAWKYTCMREEAVIEFGIEETGGEPAFFVRDNGPGFDMAHADKLFVPFQRLPGADEFHGHGIGLATVERIIRRHGGRVWAEGEPGKGATFRFTLP